MKVDVKNIWKAAAIEPAGEWYVSAGAGMGDVLKMADEKQAYTITDRATYLSMVDTLELEIVCEKDADMLNPYGVITVNPEKNDQINAEGAKAFADWLVSENGQKLIGEFGVEEFGGNYCFIIHSGGCTVSDKAGIAVSIRCPGADLMGYCGAVVFGVLGLVSNDIPLFQGRGVHLFHQHKVACIKVCGTHRVRQYDIAAKSKDIPIISVKCIYRNNGKHHHGNRH